MTEVRSGRSGSPPLPPLATADDIVDRLGRNLNQVESARITALLADGSAIIRRYAREDFVFYDSDTITLVSDGGIIKLPWKPIASIDSVTAHSGMPSIPDIPVTWYIFDGVDTVTVPSPWHSGIINLPEFWYEYNWWTESYTVVGSHGYVDCPAEVTAVLCTAIVSELSTPTMSATLASESIGPYSYSMRRTSGAGLQAALMDAGLKTVLADFRQSHGTIKIRM
jgi:hypothetical protein